VYTPWGEEYGSLLEFSLLKDHQELEMVTHLQIQPNSPQNDPTIPPLVALDVLAKGPE